MNPKLIAFFQETINRFFQKSPQYFKWWQMISAILSLAGWLPSILSGFGIHTSEGFVSTMKLVGAFFAGTFLLARTPIKGQQVAVSQNGDLLKKIDTKTLPMTASEEIKDAMKDGGVLNDQTPKLEETIVKVDK